MSGRYDKFMVHVGIGTNRKLRRLTVAQRWAFVAGVLPLAAQSPMRGALLISDDQPVEAEDVRDEATISLKDARSALEELRKLGMLERDEHGVEWVTSWSEFQVEPRITRPDPNEGRRKALQRDPALRDAVRARDGDVCRYCGKVVSWTDRRSGNGGTYDHLDASGENTLDNLVVACRRCNSVKGSRPLNECGRLGITLQPKPSHGSNPNQVPTKPGSNEVEVEEQQHLVPPDRRDEDELAAARSAKEAEKASDDVKRLCRLLADLIAGRDPKFRVVKADSSAWLREMRLLVETDRRGDVAEVERVLRWSQQDPFWQGNILSPDKLRQQFTQLLARSGADVAVQVSTGARTSAAQIAAASDQRRQDREKRLAVLTAQADAAEQAERDRERS